MLLEQKLEKDLLHLACRHHMMELILTAVFNESMGASSGPDVPIFKRFQQQWEFIDVNHYDTSITHEVAARVLNDSKEYMIAFATAHLCENQPRNDYPEFLELVIIFLGGIPPRGIKFAKPGAVHHARWMAKASYTFKMWLHRIQYALLDQSRFDQASR